MSFAGLSLETAMRRTCCDLVRDCGKVGGGGNMVG